MLSPVECDGGHFFGVVRTVGDVYGGPHHHNEGDADMDILTRIRNTRAADLDNVRSDFDDAPIPVYTSRVPAEMKRIVPGADDLRPVFSGRVNDGKSASADWTGDRDATFSVSAPFRNVDRRSNGQVKVMEGLLDQLEELDADTFAKARDYTNGMTEHGKWTPGREGNASAWIGRMIAKTRELKDAARAAAPVATESDYALEDSGPGDFKFYRVTKWQGRTYIRVQASDEFHPIRNAGHRKAILTTIRTVGVDVAMGLYGQHIGRCGRCHRTLTDATSRSIGIGPDCRSQL